MKAIHVPEDVSLELGIDAEGHAVTRPFSFVGNFLLQTILVDRKWGVTVADLMVAISLRDTFKNAKPGDLIPVRPGDLEKLQDVVRQPSDPYNPRIMIYCETFLSAVLSPETVQ